MSRTISAGMQTHLDSEVTSLATCWTINRLDGVTMYFTDHDQDIVFGGNTYLAATGFTRSAVEETSDLSVDNMELAGILDSSAITVEDVRAGKYDYATVTSFLVNHEDPDTFSSIPLRSGAIGEAVSTANAETFTADFRGLLQNYAQNIGEIYQEECRADLGDDRCKIILQPPEMQRSTAYTVGTALVTDTIREDLAVYTDERRWGDVEWVCIQSGTTAGTAPTYDAATIGIDVTDGTCIFRSKTAWTLYSDVVEVFSRKRFRLDFNGEHLQLAEDWFKYGAVVFKEGPNTWKAYEVKSYELATDIVELFLPVGYDISVGELVSIYAGCGKGLETYCRARFDNVVNFRGEPFIPGTDQAAGYPNPKTQ